MLKSLVRVIPEKFVPQTLYGMIGFWLRPQVNYKPGNAEKLATYPFFVHLIQYKSLMDVISN
jgi:hypothetical protein